MSSKRVIYSTPFQQGVCLALIVAALLTSGCVRRRLTIRSNPPGAQVYIDNHEIGVTPVSTNFTYYGKRQIRLIKDGYETLTVYEPIDAPVYQIPPLDFFSETVSTSETRDERTLTYQLRPQVLVPGDILQARAEQLRLEAHTPDAALMGGPIGLTNGIPRVPNVSPLNTLPAPTPLQGPAGPGFPQGLPPGSPVPETLPPGGQPPIFAPPMSVPQIETDS